MVPITTVRDNSTEQRYQGPDGQDDRFSVEANKSITGSAGCPVAVQVVGLPFHDEKTLGIMKLLQDQVSELLEIITHF